MPKYIDRDIYRGVDIWRIEYVRVLLHFAPQSRFSLVIAADSGSQHPPHSASDWRPIRATGRLYQ